MVQRISSLFLLFYDGNQTKKRNEFRDKVFYGCTSVLYKIFMQLFRASFESKFFLYKFIFQVFSWQFPDQVSRTSPIKAPLHKLKIYFKWFLNETSFPITIKENLKNFFSFLFRFNAEWKFFNAKQFRKAVLMCCVYEFLYLWVFLKQSL